jgi:hypothetical protein
MPPAPFRPFVFRDLTGAAFHVRAYRRAVWIFRWVPRRAMWDPLRPAEFGEAEAFREIALTTHDAATYHAAHARTRPGA